MLLSNIVGYAASVVGISLMLPQVIKAVRTKRMRDVSLLMIILYVLNCALWLTYGLLLAAPPVILTNGTCLAISLLLLGLKLHYHGA